MSVAFRATNNVMSFDGWCEILKALKGGRRFYRGLDRGEIAYAAFNNAEFEGNRRDRFVTHFHQGQLSYFLHHMEAQLVPVRTIYESPNIIEETRKLISRTSVRSLSDELGKQLSYVDTPIEVLKNMRERTLQWHRQGWRGTLRAAASFIQNMFLTWWKWDGLYVGSKIKWPGENCTYSLKLIQELERIKKVFVQKVIPADTISRLEGELRNIVGGDISEKAFKVWMRAHHSDRNSDAAATEQFKVVSLLRTTLRDIQGLLDIKSEPAPQDSEQD